jgi:hypothetical protein
MRTAALTALFISSTALVDTSVAAATPASRPAACYADAALSRAIHCKGHGCGIDRAALDCWLENTTDMARSARIVPSIHDGRPSGFKLYAERPGSLFAHLQIQNGDELQTINGMDLSSPDKALEVYSRLRSASTFEVGLVRKSAPLTLRYELVGPAPESPPTRATAFSAAELAEGVRCKSAGRCSISRALFDRLFADETALMEMRVVPFLQDGKATGFKLFSIRAESFFDRIGLRNGDVVAEINGQPFHSPEQALNVYTQVRGSSEISMVVLRNGQRSTMEYTIR